MSAFSMIGGCFLILISCAPSKHLTGGMYLSRKVNLQVYPQENLESFVFRLKEDKEMPLVYSTPMLVDHLTSPKNYHAVRVDSILSEQLRNTSISYRTEKSKIILYQKGPSL